MGLFHLGSNLLGDFPPMDAISTQDVVRTCEDSAILAVSVIEPRDVDALASRLSALPILLFLSALLPEIVVEQPDILVLPLGPVFDVANHCNHASRRLEGSRQYLLPH
jgi:hypothetical protein